MKKCNICEGNSGETWSYEGHLSLRANFSVIFASDFILRILCQSLQYALLALCAGDRLCHPAAPSARPCQAIFSSSEELTAFIVRFPAVSCSGAYQLINSARRPVLGKQGSREFEPRKEQRLLSSRGGSCLSQWQCGL